MVGEIGNSTDRLSFDARGRRRNATDWTYNNVPATFLFDRGFTGHEHMDAFGLIKWEIVQHNPGQIVVYNDKGNRHIIYRSLGGYYRITNGKIKWLNSGGHYWVRSDTPVKDGEVLVVVTFENGTTITEEIDNIYYPWVKLDIPKTAPAGRLSGEGGNYSINNAVNWLNENSHPTFSAAKATGDGARCAYFIRMALEAGGINTADHPVPARLYGPYLKKWGFTQINTINYFKGDIAVIQGYPGGTADKNGVPYGHIQMYNGIQWLSNFYQNSFWPGTNYQKYHPAFQIYRMNP